MTDDIYYLGVQELMILAKSAGMKQLFGIEQKEQLSESELMKIIHDMVLDDILRKTNQGFSVLEPYQTIVKNMKTAKRIILVTNAEDDLMDITFFVGEQVVSMQSSLNDSQKLKFGMIPLEHFYQSLGEWGYLKDPLILKELIPLQEKEEFLEFYYNHKINKKYLGIFTIYDLNEAGEVAMERVYKIVKHPFNYWIAQKAIAIDGQKVTDETEEFDHYYPLEFYKILVE